MKRFLKKCFSFFPAGKGYRFSIIIVIFFSTSVCLSDTSGKSIDAGSSMNSGEISRLLRGNTEHISDYTAIFLKQERINGTLMPVETIEFKFSSPRNVYMKWLKDPYKGQESLYRAGQNDNKLLAHRGGFLSFATLSLDPRGSVAMANQHHAIYDAGIGPTTELVLRGIKEGLKRNEVKHIDLGYVDVEGRKARCIETVYPEKREGIFHTVKKGENLWDIADHYQRDMFVILSSNKGIDSPGDIREGQRILVPHHYCHRIKTYIDDEYKLMVRLEIYDWDNNLYEMYHYKDIRINAGLTRADFDPENRQYNF